MALSAKETQEKYGLSPEDIDKIECAASTGTLPGKPGEVAVGRPLKFGQALTSIGYKEIPEVVNAIDKRASELGFSRSDYLRNLVRKDLASA